MSRACGAIGCPAKVAMCDPQYVEACAQAVEHIATAEGKPSENSYRRPLPLLQRKTQSEVKT